MAERRMIKKAIIDSDSFLDMPALTRLLYFDLCVQGDDDGFLDSPRRVLRTTGATDEDLNMLAENGYIIKFESGVVVIKHWKVHNSIRADRYKATQYLREKSMLTEDESGAYSLKVN